MKGTIALWDLSGGAVLTTRGAFLAAWGEVDINVSIARRAGAALFGGEGVFMRTLIAPSRVLLQTLKRQTVARR